MEKPQSILQTEKLLIQQDRAAPQSQQAKFDVEIKQERFQLQQQCEQQQPPHPWYCNPHFDLVDETNHDDVNHVDQNHNHTVAVLAESLFVQGLSDLQQAKEDASIQFKFIQTEYEQCQSRLNERERELKEVQKRLLKYSQQEEAELSRKQRLKQIQSDLQILARAPVGLNLTLSPSGKSLSPPPPSVWGSNSALATCFFNHLPLHFQRI